MSPSIPSINVADDRPMDWGPACNILSTDVVGMRGVSTRLANKLGLRSAVSLLAMPALRTRSRRITWIDQHQRNAGDGGLVRHECSELKERPPAVSCTLALPNSYPITDALEIFEGNRTTGAFSLSHKTLSDGVVGVGTKAGLFVRKFLKRTFGSLRPTGLQARAKVEHSNTNGFDGLASVPIAIRIGRNVTDTKVYAQSSDRSDGRAIGDFDGHVQVPVALAKDQVCLTSLGSKQGTVVVAHHKRYQSAFLVQRFDRDTVDSFERQDAFIVGNSATRLEVRADGLVPLVDLANLRDCANGQLRGQVELGSKLVVVVPLQVKLTGTVGNKSDTTEPVACRVKLFHHRKQRRALFWIRDQFDLRDELQGPLTLALNIRTATDYRGFSAMANSSPTNHCHSFGGGILGSFSTRKVSR